MRLEPAMVTRDPTPRGFLDRDVICDRDGRVWTVLGHIQPEDRVIAFLKYVPDEGGRWSRDGRRLRRVFWGGVQSVSDGMAHMPSEYQHNDPHFGTLLPSVPIPRITEHHRPENRLRAILECGARDPLEEKALEFAELLADSTGVRIDSFGVAGSLAWHAHSPTRSDINMCVYGFENAWRLQEAYEHIPDMDGRVTLRENRDWLTAKSRIVSRVPKLDIEDLHSLFERRRALYLGNRCIGVTPILWSHEVPIPYLSERYQGLFSEPVKITFDVRDASYSLFLPSLYRGESGELEAIGDQKVRRLMIYEGAFRGLAREGDSLEVVGTLQRVLKPPGEIMFYQIMVGTKAGAGKEYIRLL
ncbi:hypothetical protein EU520_00195 [Candidatus Thorarchaeota archaeon]|nr:MAG: hypothetical protein EU520_00195 [Candidatus Thorarchaeota archaeon]